MDAANYRSADMEIEALGIVRWKAVMKKALLGSPPVSCVLCPGLGRKVTGDLDKCGVSFLPRCWGQAMRKKARPFVEKGPPAGCQNLFTHLSPCCPSSAALTCSGEVVWEQGQASEQLRSLKGTVGGASM